MTTKNKTEDQKKAQNNEVKSLLDEDSLSSNFIPKFLAKVPLKLSAF